MKKRICPNCQLQTPMYKQKTIIFMAKEYKLPVLDFLMFKKYCKCKYNDKGELIK
jgi:hypothetical protein